MRLEPKPADRKLPLIETLNIGKSFSGVRVLHDINFTLYPGEVHALVGENGAGKSTFVKILSGVHQPSSGHIRMNGQNVTVPSPTAARKLGISLIHQEPLSFPHLSVAENIFLGHMQSGLMGWRDIYRQARRLLDSLRVHLDEQSMMGELSIADQQMVEIASALSQDTRVIIMDEPTAALTPVEAATLFRIVRQLKASGHALVFISHRLEEVREIADKVTVLRDGEHVHTGAVTHLTNDDIIRLMIGRPLKEQIRKEVAVVGETVLRVHGLSRAGVFEDVSFDLRKGEIVGLAGLIGAGRTDVAKAIFGTAPATGGSIEVRGERVSIISPHQAIRLGIAYVPEDRALMGIFKPLSVEKNITSAVPERVSRLGFLRPKQERALAEAYADKLRIRRTSIRQPIGELSGGNQQKAVLARWLLTRPGILILDEPTRGIDVGVKAEVYDIINQLAQQGAAVLMISSELPEIIALSDRILVMSEGRVTAVFSRADASQEAIMRAAVPKAKREAA